MSSPNQRRYFISLFIVLLGAFPTLVRGQAIYWDPADGGNGHWYEWVEAPGTNWLQASSDAAQMSYQGLNGYLATITTEAENLFIQNQVLDASTFEAAYIGGFQPSVTEPWGPWAWVTGEAWDYTNWSGGEPNQNAGPGEYLEVYTGWNNPGRRGWWNDIPGTLTQYRGAYIVEYADYKPYATPNAFVLLNADTPTSGNFGQVGGVYGWTQQEAESEGFGNYITKRSRGGTPRDLTIDGAVSFTDTGPYALLGQTSFLNAPVLPSLGTIDPGSKILSPNFIGREVTGYDSTTGAAIFGEDAIHRARELDTTATGAFVLDRDATNLRLRLVASSQLESFTTGGVTSDASEITGWITSMADAYGSKVAALIGDLTLPSPGETVEFLLDPAESRYQADIGATFSAALPDGSVQELELTLLDTEGYRENHLFGENELGGTRRERVVSLASTDAFAAAAGQAIEWRIDFHTGVETEGFASADASMTGYYVEVLSDNERIGVIHHTDDPIANTEGVDTTSSSSGGILALTAAVSQDMASPSTHDLINNLPFESALVEDLAFGDVTLIENAGELLPTAGERMMRLGVDDGTTASTYITRLLLPDDPDALRLDVAWLADAVTTEDVVLSVIVGDINGHFDAADWVLGEAGWSTLSLDISQLDGTSYLMISLQGDTDQPIGVVIDNLWTVSTPVPEPASIALMVVLAGFMVSRNRSISRSFDDEQT